MKKLPNKTAKQKNIHDKVKVSEGERRKRAYKIAGKNRRKSPTQKSKIIK